MKSPRPRGNERLQKMRADPERATRVAAIREQMREMDHTYALNLAAVRRAAALTQIELSQRLGVGQGAISKIENQDDWLLSTPSRATSGPPAPKTPASSSQSMAKT
jgi:DNA-binding XRE family transcriptional regulator